MTGTDRPLRVMIVEDEGVISLSLKEILEAWGYGVCSIASSAEDAVGIAEKEAPDLVLMDVKIRGKQDGIETARIMRERFGTPSIFMSGYMDEGIIGEMQKAKPAGIVSKPVDFDELQEIMEKFHREIK